MKKFLSLLCMITCVFGLTACGSTEALTAYEQNKVDKAISVARDTVIPSLLSFQNATDTETYQEYTAEEVAYIVEEKLGISTDGYAYLSAIESFNSAVETIGTVVEIGEATAEIDDDQIIVHVEIIGEKKTAEAEVILTNDRFVKMESAALNPKATMKELMATAGLNTLIGMGTVFMVLILICFIISCFSFIPKIQAMFSKKKEKKEKKEEVSTVGIENAVAQIATQEEEVELSDDLELVAVIAAAIAASQGAASTDGFVVRSIRKVRK